MGIRNQQEAAENEAELVCIIIGGQRLLDPEQPNLMQSLAAICPLPATSETTSVQKQRFCPGHVQGADPWGHQTMPASCPTLSCCWTGNLVL